MPENIIVSVLVTWYR